MVGEVAPDGLVLKYQAISDHKTDSIFYVLMFHKNDIF